MKQAARPTRPVLKTLSIALGGFALAAAFAAPAQAAGSRHPLAVRAEIAAPLAQPSATAQFGCETRAFSGKRLFCYGPAAIRAAYGLDKLIASGIDGKGSTIVIIDAYGSPTVAEDLAFFDATFGLPDPKLEVIQMPGLVQDFTNNNQLGWAEETSLDVQWSHAIAPGAKIVLIEAASNNDVDLLAAQEYAIKHYPGAAISESYGESEYALLTDPTGEGQTILANDNASYIRAAKNGNSVFVSAGDSGVSGDDGTGATAPFQVGLFPATSPNVTAVGGTSLYFGANGLADPNGTYQTEYEWNDGFGTGGGGISAAFAQPLYQTANLPASTLSVLQGARGYPDISYNAGVVGGVLVHLGFFGGTYIFGGTSAGAPQMAGVAALARQIKGEPLGLINPRLYKLGAAGKLAAKTHDVVGGDNGNSGVKGYPALPGFDLSTGWGTPSAGLVKLLAGED